MKWTHMSDAASPGIDQAHHFRCWATHFQPGDVVNGDISQTR